MSEDISLLEIVSDDEQMDVSSDEEEQFTTLMGVSPVDTSEAPSKTSLLTLRVQSQIGYGYGDVYANVGGGVPVSIRDGSNDKWTQALSVYQRLGMSEIIAEKELAYRSLTAFIANKEIPNVHRLHAFNLVRDMELTPTQDVYLRGVTLNFFDEVTTCNNGWSQAVFTDILRAMMELSLSTDQFLRFIRILTLHLGLDTAQTYNGATRIYSSVNSRTISVLCNVWSIILDLSVSLKRNTQSEDAILQLSQLKKWALGNFQRFLERELSSQCDVKLLNHGNYTTVIDRITRYRECLTSELVVMIINDYVDRWESYISPTEVVLSRRRVFHTKRIITLVTSIKYNPRDEPRMLRMDYTSLPTAVRWDEFGTNIIRMVVADDATMAQKRKEKDKGKTATDEWKSGVKSRKDDKADGFMCVGIIEDLYLDERNTAKAWGKVLANYHVFSKNPPAQTIDGEFLFLDSLECSEYTFYSYILDLCLLIYRESRNPWEKQKAVERMIQIGEDEQMDGTLRGLAIDKLLQTHNLMYEKKANAIVDGMNAESRSQALKERGVVYRLFDDAENSHDETITKSAEESVINLAQWYYDSTDTEEFHDTEVKDGVLMGTLTEMMKTFSINYPDVLKGISFQKVDHTLRRCYTDKTVVTVKRIRVREVIGYICAYINIEYVECSEKYLELYHSLYTYLQDSYKICGSGVVNRVICTLVGVTDMVKQCMDPMTAIINRLKARYNARLRKMGDAEVQAQLMMEMLLEAPELRQTYEQWRQKNVVEILIEIKHEDLTSEEDDNNEYKDVWGLTSEWPIYKGKSLTDYDPLKMD